MASTTEPSTTAVAAAVVATAAATTTTTKLPGVAAGAAADGGVPAVRPRGRSFSTRKAVDMPPAAELPDFRRTPLEKELQKAMDKPYRSTLDGWTGEQHPTSPSPAEKAAGGATVSVQASAPEQLAVAPQPAQTPLAQEQKLPPAESAKPPPQLQHKGGKQQQQQKQKQQKQQKQSRPEKPESPLVRRKDEAAGDEAEQPDPQVQGQPQQPRVGKPKTPQFDDSRTRKKVERKMIVPPHTIQDQVALFSHLPQYRCEGSLTVNIPLSGMSPVPPEIIRLGLKYADFSILGSNARCLAMLSAFRQVIETFPDPPNDSSLAKELENAIKPMIQFLVDCRPISISMGNAINYLKLHISNAREKHGVEEEKQYLLECIDDFVQKRILTADELIASRGQYKVVDGDVIMTHASSHVVSRLLLAAHTAGRNFRVIVVESRPLCEGIALVRTLAGAGIHCTYALPSAVPGMMREVTKVIVGAYSMLSNGSLVSRVGTAMVASLAQAFRVPFIVCCETYKFSDRVLLDSFCYNQLGDPQRLVEHPTLAAFKPSAAAAAEAKAQSEKQQKSGQKKGGDPAQAPVSSTEGAENLKLLNLVYDLTPVDYIAMVITEFGMIPPTSVPVIIREFRADQMM
eukprot:TRINITY_DN412_c0_g1_i1.p1 TRINITY_DN412_c0_g1~~TRINITY_DN412_c0_g1_i1.p1  ORF type:complete len:636 (+),score=191.18 TRINITY_DN412_c0_g1_i1:28-1908(+)